MKTSYKYFLKNYACFIIMIFMVACDDNTSTGEVEINFYPVVNNNNDITRYWYLYPEIGPTKSQYIDKGYLSATDQNGRVNLSINNLNPGNYIFRYYVNDTAKDNGLQVSAGQMKRYRF